MEQANPSLVGTGGFSHVFKAIWKDMPDALSTQSPHPETMPVAIKISSKAPESEQMLLREIAIHRRLSHPNIVAFLGVIDETPSDKKGLVMELMLHGDLLDMLSAHKGLVSSFLRCSIARDVARGLHYLHDLGLLHRDLKCENILIEKQGETIIAKICDFGFTVSIDDHDEFNHLRGTPIYLAPELLQSKPPLAYSTKSDIYAFSLILWMLTSQRTPHQQFSSRKDLFQFVKAGQRERIPKGTSIAYAQLITDSWQQNPDHRPLTLDIIHRLSEMLTRIALSTGPADIDRLLIKSPASSDLNNKKSQTAEPCRPGLADANPLTPCHRALEDTSPVIPLFNKLRTAPSLAKCGMFSATTAEVQCLNHSNVNAMNSEATILTVKQEPVGSDWMDDYSNSLLMSTFSS